MILWRDITAFLRDRYEIIRLNYEISRCVDCQSEYLVRVCSSHREKLRNNRSTPVWRPLPEFDVDD